LPSSERRSNWWRSSKDLTDAKRVKNKKQTKKRTKILSENLRVAFSLFAFMNHTYPATTTNTTITPNISFLSPARPMDLEHLIRNITELEQSGRREEAKYVELSTKHANVTRELESVGKELSRFKERERTLLIQVSQLETEKRAESKVIEQLKTALKEAKSDNTAVREHCSKEQTEYRQKRQVNNCTQLS
jgi:vacuolar-type H+-ATPase subunit I/STV1